MDKIFEKETVEYLKGFGISEGEIAKLQKQKLKESAISILERATRAINKEDFSIVRGATITLDDGWHERTFLKFGDIAGAEEMYDLGTLFDEIKKLNNIINGKQKGE